MTTWVEDESCPLLTLNRDDNEGEKEWEMEMMKAMAWQRRGALFKLSERVLGHKRRCLSPDRSYRSTVSHNVFFPNSQSNVSTLARSATNPRHSHMLVQFPPPRPLFGR